MRVRPWPRVQELGRSAKDALWLVSGAVPLLAVAVVVIRPQLTIFHGGVSPATATAPALALISPSP